MGTKQDSNADPREPPTVTCAGCGESAAGPPMTWMFENEGRGHLWYCPGCSRTHLRAVEAKLSPDWW